MQACTNMSENNKNPEEGTIPFILMAIVYFHIEKMNGPHQVQMQYILQFVPISHKLFVDKRKAIHVGVAL